jgi:phenylalanyl-tRNA synthetase beta subunit
MTSSNQGIVKNFQGQDLSVWLGFFEVKSNQLPKKDMPLVDALSTFIFIVRDISLLSYHGVIMNPLHQTFSVLAAPAA